MNLRHGVNRVHLWIGLAIALPLILMSLSGSVLVYRWSLDARINHDWYGVGKDIRTDPESVPWDLHLERARSSAGGGEVRLFWVSPAGRGSLIAETADHTRIHLEPHSGNVIGVREHSSWRSIIWWIQEFHRTLFLGEWGSSLVSALTAVSLLSLFTGAVLWLLPFSKSGVARFGVRLKRGLVRANWDAHNAVGFYGFLVLMVILGTGVMIGFWPTVQPLVYGLTNSDPVGFEAPPAEPEAGRFSLRRSVRQAEEEWPGALLRRVSVPRDDRHPVRMRFRTEGSPYEPGLSWIWVDPYQNSVVKTHSPDTRSSGDDVYLWLFPLHFGDWGLVWGKTAQVFTKIVWFLASLSAVFLSVSGCLIWYWKRP